MKARSILLAIAVVAIGAVAWLALRSPSRPAVNDVVSIEVPRTDEPEPERNDELAGVTDAAGAGGRIARPMEIEEVADTFLASDHPWAGQLAGVKGRLVEEDGTPVPDMRVELIEADLSVLFSSEHSALGREEPEVAEAFTKEDGTFFLGGARDVGFHALNIDRGGGRATIRVIEQSLEHGEVTDLGDIVMDTFGTLIGTVIDEDGEPVPGARIRATVLPEIVMQTGILDAREGIVLTGKDAENQAFEVPPVAFALFERLPIPTTYTDSNGAFRLEGVPVGLVSGGADKEGHVAAILGPVNVTPSEVDVGELELLFGRNVTGKVTDELEEPVEGVEVVVGAYHPLFPVAIMQPAGGSDDAGLYSTIGIPEDGQLVGAVRRHKSESWQVVEGKFGSDSIDFVLPAALRLTCRIVDESGEPVEGAEVRIRPSFEEGNEMAFVANMAMRGRMPMAQTRASEIEAGTYVVEDLKLGSWLVEARAPGRAIVRDQITLSAESQELELVAPTGRTVRVVVTDEVTGLPVPAAHASLLGPEGFFFTAFASGFTNEEGATTLGPLSPTWHEDAKEDAAWLEDIVVSVEHPQYGMAKADVAEDATEIALALPPSCTVEGRVHWAGDSPLNVYMVTMRWRDDEDAFAQATMLPKTGLTNLEGNFRITGLAPGEYEMYVLERYFDGNPIKLILDQREPNMIDRRDVTLDPEEPTYVDVELSPEGLGPSGRFAGRVTVDEQPLVGAEVTIGNREPEVLFTDSLGEFESIEYSVLKGLRVTIEGDVPLPDGSTETRQIYRDWKRPNADEVVRIDLDLAYTYLTVQAVDKFSGRPVSDVEVKIDSGGPFRRNRTTFETDSSGLTQVLLADKSEHQLVATHEGYSRSTAKVKASMAEDGKPVRIELEPRIPCAGTVRFVDGTEPPREMWMHVTTSGFEDSWTQVSSEEMTFEFEGLVPGTYKAELWGGPRRGMLEANFELPEGGDVNLVLEFGEESEDEDD
ncbi:MAG: carboxypeptidase-like regulatory domain-containing protein [Planctomycetota bacterium]